RVEDAPDARDASVEHGARAVLGELADADHDLRGEGFDRLAQGAIARAEEELALARRELLRHPIAAALLHEDERAVVVDEEAVEEALGGGEALARPAPEPRPAHLGALRREAEDRALRVLLGRLLDLALD